MGVRILVVASDAQLRATLARWLMSAGYGVELAEGLRRARDVLTSGDIALAIVVPDRLATAGDPDPIRALRDSVPHLIAIGDEAQAAIDANASPIKLDLAASTPSAQHDLLERVRAQLQDRSAPPDKAEPLLLRFADYALDAGGRTLRNRDGQDIPLTAAEFSMLLALARQAGRVLSRDELSQAALGRAAGRDDRSVDVLISRLRRKIEPAPKTPTIILTVASGGYKLGIASEIVAAPPPGAGNSPPAASPLSGAESPPPERREATSPAPPLAPRGRQARALGSSSILVVTSALLVLAGIAGLVVAFRSTGSTSRGPTSSAVPAQKFDAAAIPLVLDLVRAQLAGYEREPPAKAIAISREGWGLSAGAADEAAARNEAIARCRERDKVGFCRLYAVGDKVVWSSASLPLPLPADIRDDRPASPSVTPESLANLWQTVWHVAPPPVFAQYPRGKDHRALAVALTSSYRTQNRPSRDEAMRIAIERCSDYGRTACLLISVDGLWTVRMPRSYAIAAPFTLAGELQMSDAERQEVARVYAGKDWRALVRGQSGAWYPVAARPSEAAAVDDALKACHAAETGCTVHAIGNWRVGGKLEGGGTDGGRH